MKNEIVSCLVLGLSVVALAGVSAPRWISGGSAAPEAPAPTLARTFVLPAKPAKATLELAVAGWCEVCVNGVKQGDSVLAPVTCQPDARVSSLTFDVAAALVPGTNVVAVTLGNGWWNTFTKDSWFFSDATWPSAPKACGRLVVNGADLFVTDGSWRAWDSPIVFTALRNGEWYDARLEGKRPHERAAKVEKYAPWGAVSPEDAAPCRAFDSFAPVRTLKAPDGDTIYDFGANIAGWCETTMSGEAGAKVTFEYDETLTPSNTFLGHVAIHVRRRGGKYPFQHDEYTLAGRAGGETWHPRFTYHGFRYVKVNVKGKAKVDAIRARFVHSDFPCGGTLETSDATFADLQRATLRSYLSNFVGIPTDCPHREKNGWTGDTQLAMETGLWNFDARAGYEHFLRMMLDAQRPNGAVPCILPASTGFGFFWGSGPAWDAVLFEIPWQIFRFYGDDAPAREAYDAMKKYVAFIMTKADADGLVDYGLGDWCPVERNRLSSTRLTDSAYVYCFHCRLAFWAERFGDEATLLAENAAAEKIKAAFNKAFYKGNGLYAAGRWAELAAPLYFAGLCADGEEKKVFDRLVAAVRANGHKVDFGILGAKWVPRVLAARGCADDAWKLFTQKEYPGWAYWLQFGDGTLRETWNSDSSHNHIMFGDLSAWAYEYAAGIVPLAPGFAKVAIRPHYLAGVERFAATHRTPYGEIRVAWRRENGKPVCEWSAPEGVEVVEAP